MPWLLAGAKTLSYAVNMAALRHAARGGAGDVIFVSSDGYILEGPRSTVVIAAKGDEGRTCLLTPPPWYPILRGTTQQALFEVARDNGYDCDYRVLRPADLFAAQGVWLVSSITLAARVHTLDGRPLAPGAVGRRGGRTGRRGDRQRSLTRDETVGETPAPDAGTVGRTQGRRWSGTLRVILGHVRWLPASSTRCRKSPAHRVRWRIPGSYPAPEPPVRPTRNTRLGGRPMSGVGV